MKKVQETKSPKNKSEKSTIITLVVIAIVVVIGIATYFIFFGAKTSNNPNIVNYNNYIFQKSADNQWYTQMQIRNTPYNIGFHYNPFEVQNVTYDSTYIAYNIKTFQSRHPDGNVYITVDPDASSKLVVAGVEIAKILGKAYNIYNFNVSSSITRAPQGFAGTYPIITCSNATGDTMVVWMVVNKENRISMSNNCVIVESISDNESSRVADALAFRLLDIMQ